MNNQIEKWVDEWAIEDSDDGYRKINGQINFLSDALFHDYQPTQASAPDFFTRLEDWLRNVVDKKDKKNLFKLLPHLFYMGSKEFNSLYRMAYNEIIARWIIDVDNISLTDFTAAKTDLDNALLNTWICPITDSMNINSFYHINNVPGEVDYRPQWYNSNQPWNTISDGLVNYINNNGVNKLVLMEDFVGSGSQVEQTIVHAINLGLSIPILFIPLVICPDGVGRFNNLQAAHAELTYKSTLELSDNCFVLPAVRTGEDNHFPNVRELVDRVYNLTSCGIAAGSVKPYSPFGFRQTGGLVVMHSNTPDNSLPVIHHESNSWSPIFKRHSRN